MSVASVRFYRDVSVEPAGMGPEGACGYCVFLDGKPVRTPGRAVLMLPLIALAEAVAGEWRAQEAKIRLDTMVLTRLANTAIDRAPAHRAQMIKDVVAFGGSDLLCYRAEMPDALIRRQVEVWDPLLKWADRKHGIRLTTGAGVRFVEQPVETLAALERAIEAHSDFSLVGLHGAVGIAGSAVIGLAMAEGHIDGEQAFVAATIDEAFQAERWGADPEAQAASQAKREELIVTARFFKLLRE